MSNNYISIIGLIISLYIICNAQTIKEGWEGMGSQMPVITQSYVNNNGNKVLLPQNSNIFNNIIPSLTDKIVSYPSLQSTPPPRFSSSGGYGSFIRSNIPSESNLAVPTEPLVTYSFTPPIVKESFHSDNTIPLPKITNTFYNTTPGTIAFGDGLDTPVVVANDLMWANSKSNLRSQGDWIRGDLAIVPCEPGWFRPSINPSRDLNSGALAVMGGIGNSATSVADLKSANSGALLNTSAGVTFITGSVNNRTGGINYTAFP